MVVCPAIRYTMEEVRVVAIRVAEVEMRDEEGFRTPQVGDYFEINFGDRDKPDWWKFWNFPLRDGRDTQMALDIIRSQGMSHIYSKPSFARDFRSVSPRGYVDRTKLKGYGNENFS